MKEFLISYGYLPQELTAALSHHLTVLMLLHRYIITKRYTPEAIEKARCAI